METLGKFTATIFIGTLSSIYGGFVLAKVWCWLLVPTFGFRELQTIHGMSISLIMSILLVPILLRLENKQDGKSEIEKVVAHAFASVILYTFLLGFGFIYSLFI